MACITICMTPQLPHVYISLPVSHSPNDVFVQAARICSTDYFTLREELEASDAQ